MTDHGVDRPPANAETQVALRFHAATTYRALPGAGDEPEYVMGTPPHVEDPIWQQDWSIEPRPYKIYPTLEPLELPAELSQTQLPTQETIASGGLESPSTPTAVPDRAALAQLCRLSNGLLHRRLVTAVRKRVVEFRTAAATGARYHLELYIVCGDLPDLPAGVYHYATQDHRLRQLRAGDVRGVLVAATGGEPSLAQAPAALLMTSTFWRNAWRYKARAYRHTFWDAGTSLANLLAVAASLGLPARLVLGFADADVNRLLGIDGQGEATVAICALGAGRPAPPAPESLEPIDPPVEPVSAREVVFPDIPRLHAASSLDSGDEAAAWRRAPLRRTLPAVQGRLIRLAPLAAERLPTSPVEATILARRSARHYDTETPLSFEAFSTVLDRSTRAVAADCLDPRRRRCTTAT